MSPSVVDPAGDSFVTVHGTALGTVTAVRLDETPVPFSVDAAGEIHLKTSAVAEGAHRLTVTNASGFVTRRADDVERVVQVAHVDGRSASLARGGSSCDAQRAQAFAGELCST